MILNEVIPVGPVHAELPIGGCTGIGFAKKLFISPGNLCGEDGMVRV